MWNKVRKAIELKELRIEQYKRRENVDKFHPPSIPLEQPQRRKKKSFCAWNLKGELISYEKRSLCKLKDIRCEGTFWICKKCSMLDFYKYFS